MALSKGGLPHSECGGAHTQKEVITGVAAEPALQPKGGFTQKERGHAEGGEHTGIQSEEQARAEFEPRRPTLDLCGVD